MSTRSLISYANVKDEYIRGEVYPRPRRCDRCGIRTRVIKIDGVWLPEGITLMATVLQDRAARKRDEPRCIQFIGIGCGCYAKFHRQICHIQGR